MELNKMVKLIDNIIGNEFNHVTYGLTNDIDKDILPGYAEATKKEEELYRKLSSLLPEDKVLLLDDYYSAIANIKRIESEYLFKYGVKAGLSNLNFLNDINGDLFIVNEIKE